MPKTLPTIAATFTMEMGMHLHRLGSVGRSESQRVDTVVANCCHVYTFFTHAKWIQIASESFQVLVARSDGDGLQQNSFVNAISTPKGGTRLGRISRHHRFIRM